MASLTATVVPGLYGVRLDLDWSSAPTVTSALIYRTAGGVESLVRTNGTDTIDGSPAVTLSGGRATVYDLEAPLDTPLTYRAVANTGALLAMAGGPVTVTSGGLPLLRDPLRPSRNLTLLLLPDPDCPPDGGVIFAAMGTENYASDGARFEQSGSRRPIPVTGVRKDVTSALTLVALTFADRDALLAMLEPGTPLLFQAPPEYGITDRYMDIGDVPVSRLAADHRTAYRVFDLPHAAVDAPAGPAEGTAPSPGVGGNRWMDMCNQYATWALMDAAALTGTQVLAGAAG